MKTLKFRVLPLVILCLFFACGEIEYVKPHDGSNGNNPSGVQPSGEDQPNEGNNSNANNNNSGTNNNNSGTNNNNSGTNNNGKQEEKPTQLSFVVKCRFHPNPFDHVTVREVAMSNLDVYIYIYQWDRVSGKPDNGKYWAKTKTGYYGTALFEKLPTENGEIFYKVSGSYSIESGSTTAYYETIGSTKVTKGSTSTINIIFDWHQ